MLLGIAGYGLIIICLFGPSVLQSWAASNCVCYSKEWQSVSLLFGAAQGCGPEPAHTQHAARCSELNSAVSWLRRAPDSPGVQAPALAV